MRNIAHHFQAVTNQLAARMCLALLLAAAGCDPQASKNAPAPSTPGTKATGPDANGALPDSATKQDDADYVALADDVALETYLVDAVQVRPCPPEYQYGRIVADGAQAVRKHFLDGHLVRWNLQAPRDAGDQAFRMLLPPELPAGADQGDVETGAWSTISHDGRWLLWMRTPKGGKEVADFWRLPGDIHGKPEKFAEVDPTLIAGGSVTLDSRWMLSIHRDKHYLVRVDSDAGMAEAIPFSAPILEPWTAENVLFQQPQVQFAGPGMTVVVVTTPFQATAAVPAAVGVGAIEVSGDGKSAVLRSVRWVTRHAESCYQQAALSNDGTLLFIHNGRSMGVWRLPPATEQPAQLVWEESVSRKDSMFVAAFSPDSRLLAVQHDRQIDLYDVPSLGDKALPTRVFPLPVSGSASDLKFTSDGKRLIALLDGSAVICRLDVPWPVKAKIGDARIDFQGVPNEPGVAAWPALKATHEFSVDSPQAGRAKLTLHVRNDGLGAAHQVKFLLRGSPALSGLTQQPRPAKAADGDEPEPLPPPAIATIHFGRIAPGQTVSREIEVPWPAELANKARRFTLAAQEQHGFAPLPAHWLYLPRTLENEEQYHAQAKRVFDVGVKILEKLRGRPFNPVIALKPMGADQFGFMASNSNDRVSYQNLFKMSDYSLKVNRAVMQVTTRDELMRHGQMMLYWYLPHELVHNADNAGGWETEFIANMIQPYLTARILDEITDSPYSAKAMAAVYDRYVEVLRPQIADEDLARIERFIENEGLGAPFRKPAWMVFQSNTPAYVYFGARINQHSWAMQSTLEKVFDRYITKRKPQRE